MIDFLEIYERALLGPRMIERDFDMKVLIPTLKRVVGDYGICYDADRPIPHDDEAADRVFEAAVEFLSRVGVYCTGTNRIIGVTREEILQCIREAPGICRVGEGKDAGTLGMRRPDDPKRPWNHLGSGIVFTDNDLAMKLVEGCARIARANSLAVPAMDQIRGMPVSGGTPAELYAAIERVRIGREATRRAGRPGLPILNWNATAAATVTAIAASAAQFGCRPTDGWLCGAVSEMKIGMEIMNKIAYLLNWGANVGAETAPILGGYCGGPAGTAVVSTADILMGLVVFRGNYQLHFPMHFRLGCNTSRDLLWVISVSCQAASRNIPMPVLWNGYCAAGPNTRMYFYESAAWLLAAIPSGAPGFETPHPARAVKNYGYTPMEARFGVEMAEAAARLTRAEANPIALRLLEKYESQLADAPSGDRYQDCYDAETGRPRDAYRTLYDEIKEELAMLGIPF